MSSSYIDYPLKHKHGSGWKTNSPDYNHTHHVQTSERSTTVLPEISKYPNVHMLFHNKVITSPTSSNEEQDVYDQDNNIGSHPKNRGHKNQSTPSAVRFEEKVEAIKNVEVKYNRDEEEDGRKNGNYSEVHDEEISLEQEADGYLEKKHKGFLCKWKSYKDY